MKDFEDGRFGAGHSGNPCRENGGKKCRRGTSFAKGWIAGDRGWDGRRQQLMVRSAVAALAPMTSVSSPSQVPPEGFPVAAQPPRQSSTVAAAPAAAGPAPALAHAPAPPPGPGNAPYQLSYDAETQRYILESRDPVTGAIIFQLPPQTALGQIEASRSASAPTRLGRRVDQSA
jgi:hypothetical protein